jgi:methionyl-tRNA synthetase
MLIEPVMPEKAQECWAMLGYQDKVADHRLNEAAEPVVATAIMPPAPLFSRMEETRIAELETLLRKRVAEADRKMEKKQVISFEEFQKLDLRTGRVLAAEPVRKSNKLLRLQVDIGGEIRQIVAGMQQFYKPDELVGRDVVVVTNLAPATIFNIESNGMILAAGDTASLLIPLKPVEPGSKIR